MRFGVAVMAESQLECLDDGHINDKIPESRPEFVYSEDQRVGLELLLKEGDGAFKMHLKNENAKDFLSAREIKRITDTVKEYQTIEEDDRRGTQDDREGHESTSSLHSTYWPQLSDTDVPPLDLGWPSGGFFKGVTRVAVHTHPPKQNSPHIKEVVRRMIQEAVKVIAIVMDLLTDLNILQDLLDAAAKRGVAVYIVLDVRAAPHFLDMCNRLQVGPQHLRKMRVRMVSGRGVQLAYGVIPGNMCSKYMLVDGDKVMFGSYSFAWTSFRMDRHVITVLSGQVVDFFDNDFRELYAISENLDLYKEFHISRPAVPLPPTRVTTATAAGPKRPLIPATTSRFQVSLGEDPKDETQADLKVPAHKYYNPKYQLAFGDSAGLVGGSLQDLRATGVPGVSNISPIRDGDGGLPMSDSNQSEVGSEHLDKVGPLASPANHKPATNTKKGRNSLKNFFRSRTNSQEEGGTFTPGSSPTSKLPNGTAALRDGSFEDLTEVFAPPKGKNKRSSKLAAGLKSQSLMTINTMEENGLKSRKKRNQKCIQS